MCFAFTILLLLCDLSLVKFPCIAHQLNEVGVVVDVSGHGSVVVVPLLDSDDAITVAVTEACEELDENLFVGHLAADNLGVGTAIVDDAEVGRGNGTIAVRVELCKARVDNLLSSVVGRAAKTEQELVVADNAIFVGVEVVEENLGLVHGNGRTKVLQSPVELLLLNLPITIVVQDAERASHAANGTHAARHQGCFHSFENFKILTETHMVHVRDMRY